MSSILPLAQGVFEAWQLIPVLLLVAIIVFWVIYRRRQM